MSKIIKRIATLSFSLFFIALSAIARDFVVVIDAGHGGKDCGAVGAKAQEKDINLNVAKMLGTKISKDIANVKVVYTRDTDKYLTLQQRANIANKANGDLFISIHVNSLDYNVNGREKVSGASVFTLGLHKSEDNLKVAKRENAVIELEKDFSTTYSGFDPNSTESYIIFEMNQNKHMLQSVEFAGSIQKELTSTAGRVDKGVRQAGFWVLWATSMPSVLVELDFICNPTQEAFLASNDGQDKLATSIYNAFKKYHAAYSGQMSDVTVVEKVAQPAKYTKKETDDVLEVSSKTDDAVTYRIQILTSDKILEKSSPEFKGYYPIWSYQDNGMYKYTYESTTSFDDAKKILRKVRNKFPQAFIVKFKDGKRIK